MATQTEKIAFAAEMAFNTTDDTEFYSIAKNIWQQYGIPPHLLGGEDDKTGVQRLRENNSLSVMAVETGQYQRILKLLERPEETGFNPLHISSLGYSLMHRLMRTNYRVVRGLPEKKELAIVLLHKLHDLGVAHETNTQFGEQCIHLAARISSPELLKAYIPIIKDINVLDNEKRNALQGICTSFDFEGPHQYNWKILISAGADALNCDVRGCSIADTIERFADQKISQYMKDHFLRDIKEASLRKTIEVDVKLAPKVKI